MDPFIISYSPQGSWCQQFQAHSLIPLIVCRGPVRLEAIEVFNQLGVLRMGMLVADKDALLHPHGLTPEIRHKPKNCNVHWIKEYSGSNAEARAEVIQQIISLAKEYSYNAIFAGYGFMAEDADFVRHIENAGLLFIGPCSSVIENAGKKDQAKRWARSLNVSVVPGVDSLSIAALQRYLSKLENKKIWFEKFNKYLPNNYKNYLNKNLEEPQLAEWIQLIQNAGIDPIPVEDIQQEAILQAQNIWQKHPEITLRLKSAIGGGGKGQRLLTPSNNSNAQIANSIVDVLREVQALSPGMDKTIVLERNISQLQHQEIQLIGNGDWCISLGGRDCSVQRHEQKMIEWSVTAEALATEVEKTKDKSSKNKLIQMQELLQNMEQDAAVFGKAVGLDSVSTFECMVVDDHYYFMEMNTRLQVEHRVTEAVYALIFHCPENSNDYFICYSLIAAAVLIRLHGKKLPKPERIVLAKAAVEARINVTDDALQPAPGGIVREWRVPENIICDDQGITRRNPDTDAFIPYALTGAYDSNVALWISTADSLSEAMATLSQALIHAPAQGNQVQLNTLPLAAILQALSLLPLNTVIPTGSLNAYLFLLAQLKQHLNQICWQTLWQEWEIWLNKKNNSATNQMQFLIQSQLKIMFIWITKNPHRWLAWVLYLYYKKALRKQNDQWVLSISVVKIIELSHDWSGKAFILQPSLKNVPCDNDSGIVGLWIQPVLEFLNCFTLNDQTLQWPTHWNAAALEIALHQLSPPPKSGSSEIVAATGGMIYAQETPDALPFVQVGQYFKSGDPLYIVEVMKMFHRVCADFSGRVDEIILTHGRGEIVQRGQLLFRVTPDVITHNAFSHQDKDHNSEWTRSMCRAALVSSTSFAQ
ncbi:MAG: biotin carboxylase N-terminal domain-containing protein [Pseudomonadota bacterium]